MGEALSDHELTRKEKIETAAEKLAADKDADVIIFNFGIEPGFDMFFLEFLRKRETKRKNAVLLLTTEGGDADAAYRIGRYLQDNYETLTIVVCGWCKSAGTLICAAANELIIADAGELGPLDVQIAKADELGERSSGLAVEAAFEKLQQESFKLFIRHLTDIKDETEGRITFRTAADIAAQMVTGVMSDIFAKIDPLAVGEDYRSNLVAEEYATRLNIRPRNLQDTRSPSGLHMLLRGYPSHRFVIDRKEASNLFKRVSPPTGTIAEFVALLSRDAVVPRSSSRSQPPILEFLNDAIEKPAKNVPKPKSAKGAASEALSRRRRSGRSNGAGTSDLPGSVPPIVDEELRDQPAA